jgi:hypothetical protein
MQQASPQYPYVKEIKGSSLRRSLYLSKNYEKLKIEPESTLSWLYSRRSNKVIFGKSFIELYKIQAGIKIRSPQKGCSIKLAPFRMDFSSHPFETIDLLQSFHIYQGNSFGYLRTVRLTNRSNANAKLRLIIAHDPTSLNFRTEKDPPGDIGVNAFNRGGHVVMDDVGDSTGVRVIGTTPNPSLVYMTREKERVNELIAAGELPTHAAGMSGAVMMLTQHDLDLPPLGTSNLITVSLYNREKLEEALAEFNSLISGEHVEDQSFDEETSFSCSSVAINFSYDWAKTILHSVEADVDLLDRLMCGSALGMVRRNAYEQFLNEVKPMQRKDGLMPHSLDATREGLLETAHFLIHASLYLRLKDDKKFSRRFYPSLRRAADSLARLVKDGVINFDPSLPQGWRRRLRAGYPTGIVTEVNLIVSRALKDFADFAYSIGKGTDAARCREASERIMFSVNQRLKDPEDGGLMLNLDTIGRPHKEVTIDQVVALSYNLFDRNVASSIVHRLLEKDFETGYGPRCIPVSNPLYYNGSYGEGQLGGYWTRAAISHALLSYLAGYAGIGSIQLEKIAKLVHTDCERFGGIPGEFPYWLDPDKRSIGKEGSDPIAAARFIDVIVFGELGLSFDSHIRLLPSNSPIKWLSFHNLNLGSRGSVFIGRADGNAHVVTTFTNLSHDMAIKFQNCARIESSAASLEVLLFSNPGQLICIGSTSSSGISTSLTFPLKDVSLLRTLFVEVQELDNESGGWRAIEKVKASDKITIKLTIKPYAWKMIRLSQLMS